jgi:glycosyltransferase involved in cell wall biosynthesis
VITTGEVPDVRASLRDAGVVVVPVLHGSGTRFKILEALALARPVVSTPLGAEGLDIRDGEHLLIREIDQFPEAIIRLLRDPELGRRLGQAGRCVVEEQYSWEAAEQIMRQAFDEAEGPNRTAGRSCRRPETAPV